MSHARLPSSDAGVLAISNRRNVFVKEVPRVLLLMGPTATGKSELAVHLANSLNGEIISVDSAMVYRGMDIGTAKPGWDEMDGIPHHLIDILDPSEIYSTGQFRDQSLELINAIIEKGKFPILVGGTMLYFNSLSKGLADLPPADKSIRQLLDQQAERLGPASLYAELQRVDPDAAKRIHPNDPQRIQRALEVFRLTGKSISELCRSNNDGPVIDPIKVVIAPDDRMLLHQRIETRFLKMLENGLIDEVDALFRRGDLHEDLPAIRSVGYRQVWAFLKGESDRASMISKSTAATRQLAKRQLTWLRRETCAAWHTIEHDQLHSEVLNYVLKQNFS